MRLFVSLDDRHHIDTLVYSFAYRQFLKDQKQRNKKVMSLFVVGFILGALIATYFLAWKYM